MCVFADFCLSLPRAYLGHLYCSNNFINMPLIREMKELGFLYVF